MERKIAFLGVLNVPQNHILWALTTVFFIQDNALKENHSFLLLSIFLQDMIAVIVN